MSENREKLAALMMKHGFATGHGDTISDLVHTFDEQLRSRYTLKAHNKSESKRICAQSDCYYRVALEDYVKELTRQLEETKKLLKSAQDNADLRCEQLEKEEAENKRYREGLEKISKVSAVSDEYMYEDNPHAQAFWDCLDIARNLLSSNKGESNGS